MELPEFVQRTHAAGEQAKDTRPFMQTLAYIAIGPVKRRARVRTGAMRNSVHDRVDVTSAVVGTNIRYAPFVNAKYPFIEPGLEEALPKIEQAAKEFGIKVVGRISR